MPQRAFSVPPIVPPTNTPSPYGQRTPHAQSRDGINNGSMAIYLPSDGDWTYYPKALQRNNTTPVSNVGNEQTSAPSYSQPGTYLASDGRRYPILSMPTLSKSAVGNIGVQNGATGRTADDVSYTVRQSSSNHRKQLLNVVTWSTRQTSKAYVQRLVGFWAMDIPASSKKWLC
jgi:hypothetical protein